nr:histidine kinase [uncultured Holophaga sp.]
MRCQDVVSQLHERLFEGPRPLILLGIGLLLCGIDALTAPLGLSWALMAMSFLLPFAVLGLGPIPWQWTGDDAPKASPLRGLAQAILMSGVWVALMHTFLGLWPPPEAPPPPEMGLPFMRALGPTLLTLVVALGFGWLLSEKEHTELQKQRAERLLRESQQRALQSQLDPHVLYNALNSLAGLIQEDQEMAEEVVIRLADLYRMLAHQGSEAQIPLSDERKLVEAYLAMEQMRLGDRLRARWEWQEEGDEVSIPPLLLQPLVENAIKHGISPSSQGGEVVIRYQRQGRIHSLQVANTGLSPGVQISRGIGLGNLQARLALWAGSPGTLELARQGDWTLATVRWREEDAA